MLETTLSIAYKGGRDYLHGPDIFAQTMAWLDSSLPGAPIQDIDISFHHLARHRVKAQLCRPPEGIEPFAACAFSQSGQRQKVFLVETSEPVVGRYPYLEDELVAPMECDLAARKGVMRGPVSYSDIELWVAMTKALHYKVFPHIPGKWLFVRGRFPRYTHHSDAAEHALAIVASFNDRLTRSEVMVDGRKCAEIFFSIV